MSTGSVDIKERFNTYLSVRIVVGHVEKSKTVRKSKKREYWFLSPLNSEQRLHMRSEAVTSQKLQNGGPP